ncbi:thiopeptide-type bacteriocin biosynthesis domain-containing protein [Chryseobacterium taichungense]|uniref:Thiopeptide-type bacteriocin biosynthesis domain-containing protein n=1 Tax=Chryseobacterium taichungense TaxID=295069 RepID=A0A1H8C5L0_9FLAO|nr:lantibiotic dehydratase [Chryseobacterium taichungense]SEM90346.1 thiopeptide-type bacteriocin biosynthesis domain-containing protein [Chryseobacterium taichungense]
MLSENSFKNYQRYIIRKPTFSYDILFLEKNKTKSLEEVVQSLLENTLFTTSIFWSSPDLYKTIQLYKKGELKKSKEEKLFSTLKKYALRASTRATPYGTFAGLGIINFNKECKSQKKRIARIDLEFLDELKKTIENDERINPRLKYTVNSSVYQIAGNYRFTEPFFSQKENKIEYQLSALEKTEFIDLIYDSLQQKGKTSLDDIRSMLPDDFTEEEIMEFINDLIDSGFLVSEIFEIKDLDSLNEIISNIENDHFPDDKKYSTLLKKLADCISVINNTEPDFLPLEEINELESLVDQYNIGYKHFFHIDFLNSDKDDLKYQELYDAYASDIASAINFVGKIPNSESSNDKLIKNFINLFRVKYENQELPLLTVLDNEFGIGFPAEKSLGNIPYDDHFSGYDKNKSSESKIIAPKPNAAWLYDKIENSGQAYTLEVTDSDLPNTAVYNKKIPGNITLMGSFHQEHFFIQNMGGANASLIGRFAYLDREIENLCLDIRNTEKENNPEIIFADIRHIPAGKIGNVARNQSFSDYEIGILTEGSVKKENQIVLGDLMISVENDEVIIRSKSLNKRIIPRLSNAYNFNNSTIPAFRFLCALQYQNVSGLNFNIDYSLSHKKFFPRIVYKKIILHRATWILRETDVAEILKHPSPVDALKDYLKSIRIQQFVSLIHGDNELFLDLHNDSYLSLLLEEIRKKNKIVLTEWLMPAEDSKFAGQMVIPYRNMNPYHFRLPVEKKYQKDIERDFIPGSEWFYAKIYCSSPFSDVLIKEVLEPLLSVWKSNGMIRSFFFIRYTDPHYHIRLRLNLNNTSYFSEILQSFYKAVDPFMKNHAVWNIQLDTYRREIERYGEEYMENTELLFCYDSSFFINCLAGGYFDEDENHRLYSAIKNIDSYLSSFDFCLDDKFYFCKEMEAAFETEFDQNMKKSLYSQYRSYSKSLYNYMKSVELNEAFAQRAMKIKTLNLSRENLPSFIHMSINRWFDSSQRQFEYMCYIFLKNYYNRLLNN